MSNSTLPKGIHRVGMSVKASTATGGAKRDFHVYEDESTHVLSVYEVVGTEYSYIGRLNNVFPNPNTYEWITGEEMPAPFEPEPEFKAGEMGVERNFRRGQVVIERTGDLKCFGLHMDKMLPLDSFPEPPEYMLIVGEGPKIGIPSTAEMAFVRVDETTRETYTTVWRCAPLKIRLVRKLVKTRTEKIRETILGYWDSNASYSAHEMYGHLIDRKCDCTEDEVQAALDTLLNEGRVSFGTRGYRLITGKST